MSEVDLAMLVQVLTLATLVVGLAALGYRYGRQEERMEALQRGFAHLLEEGDQLRERLARHDVEIVQHSMRLDSHEAKISELSAAQRRLQKEGGDATPRR